jgi:hypothetical protein
MLSISSICLRDEGQGLISLCQTSWPKLTMDLQCVVQGLSSACYIFTKVVRPLVKFWRSKGFLIVVYLDDGLGFGDSEESVYLYLNSRQNLANLYWFVVSIHFFHSLVKQNLLGFFYSNRWFFHKRITVLNNFFEVFTKLCTSTYSKVTREVGLFKFLGIHSIF